MYVINVTLTSFRRLYNLFGRQKDKEILIIINYVKYAILEYQLDLCFFGYQRFYDVLQKTS